MVVILFDRSPKGRLSEGSFVPRNRILNDLAVADQRCPLTKVLNSKRQKENLVISNRNLIYWMNIMEFLELTGTLKNLS